MSNLLSSSNVCAHALGLETTPSKPVSHSMHTVHEHAEHIAHSVHDQQHGEHEDCPEDCNGGPDCAGCSAIPASITIEGFSFTPPVIAALYSMSDEAGFDKTFALEPPPPRTT